MSKPGSTGRETQIGVRSFKIKQETKTLKVQNKQPRKEHNIRNPNNQNKVQTQGKTASQETQKVQKVFSMHSNRCAKTTGNENP